MMLVQLILAHLLGDFFHLAVIILVWSWSQSVDIIPAITGDENFLLLITCIYALTMPVSVLVRNIISKWTPIQIRISMIH